MCSAAPIARPAFGSFGTPVQLLTNFFKLHVPHNLQVHFFSLSFTQQIKDRQGRPTLIDVTARFPTERNRNILACLSIRERFFQYPPAYDGRSAVFSAENCIQHVARDEPYTIFVNDEGFDYTTANPAEKLVQIQVHITHVNTYNLQHISTANVGNLNAKHLTQCLDIALAAAPLSNPHFVQVARSFYTNSRTVPLTSHYPVASAWCGFYQSVRQTCAGPHLNVDFACTAFWNGGGTPFISVVSQFAPQFGSSALQNSRAFEPLLRKLSKAFNGIKVKAMHTELSYTVHGFSKYGAADMTFTLHNRQLSVAEYFANHYNCILQYPNWPCVRVHKTRQIFIPIELLVVKPNQAYTGPFDGEAQATMRRHATVRPRVMRDIAQHNVRTVDYGADGVCRSFGLRVSEHLAELTGRVLPTPHMQYETEGDANKCASVSQGSWQQQANGNRLAFFRSAHIQQWAILNTSNLPHGDVQSFATELSQALEASGFSSLTCPLFHSCSEESVYVKIQQMCEQQRVSPSSAVHRMSLIVVIKERQDTRCYSAIKLAGDLAAGTVTQVCLAKNCSSKSRRRGHYISKLILKINAKLGGMNCYAVPFERSHPSSIPDPEFTKYPNIVLGADVSHPTGGGPSVAALVGSLDRWSYQFSACIHNQKGRQEIITEMGRMFTTVYRQWFLAMNKKFHTNAIIMFRDAVSEGQFKEVMETEVASIREACLRINPSFKPRITYILITKRHHARFFPKVASTGDCNGNIVAGTVVDTHITSNDMYDFYVNSHFAIQGTNKPSKYTVLLDENNIPTDVLQAYIFRLCHNYCRTNRSVSMVNSAYYAHHLAYRGRLYLSKARSEDKRTGCGKRGRGGAQRNEAHGRNRRAEPEVPESPTLHPAHLRRLFFV